MITDDIDEDLERKQNYDNRKELVLLSYRLNFLKWGEKKMSYSELIKRFLLILFKQMVLIEKSYLVENHFLGTNNMLKLNNVALFFVKCWINKIKIKNGPESRRRIKTICWLQLLNRIKYIFIHIEI